MKLIMCSQATVSQYVHVATTHDDIIVSAKHAMNFFAPVQFYKRTRFLRLERMFF